MNVLVAAPHYVPAYQFGGPLQVAHALSRALVARGHAVKVCTTAMATPEADLDVPLDEPVDVDGVTVFYEPVTLSRYWGFSPRLRRRLAAETAWADVVLVHFHYQFASVAAARAARKAGVPYVVFTHGSLRRSSVNGRGPGRKRLYLSALEARNFHRALFVAYHSAEELEDSLRFGRPVVVPNGIDPAAQDDAPPAGAFRAAHPGVGDRLMLLFLARLHAGKGLDLLLPAFHRLRRGGADAHLVIAGGDERGYEAEVRRMIRELGLEGHVTRTGRLEGRDKLAALRDADAYVLPSRSEGLSIAMLEAMYAGLPVVVTDRVGLWRTIRERDCGRVVPFDLDALAAALAELAALDDAGRAAMGARGRALVEEAHLWPRIADDLVARIRGALP